MGEFRIYDGTNWVDPCFCPVYVQDAAGVWQLLDPNNCDVSYFDGHNWCPITCSTGNEITVNTEINIWFDDSGSMSETLPALNVMRDDLLKDCLLPVYNNDSLLYDERVKVFNLNVGSPIGASNERFIKAFRTERNTGRSPDTNVDFVLNIVFQNEANSLYHSPLTLDQWGTSYSPQPNPNFPVYYQDILDLQNTLASIPYAIKGAVLAVEGVAFENTQFAELVSATFIDTGTFVPPYNISDLYPNKFTFQLDIPNGQTIIAPLIYEADNEVDWPVGTYNNIPLTTITGVGSGMLVSITVVEVTDKIDTFNILNLGSGNNGPYGPAPYDYPGVQTAPLTLLGEGGSGPTNSCILTVDQVDIGGSITSVLGLLGDTDRSRQFTVGDIVEFKDNPTNTLPTTPLQLQVLSVRNYNAIQTITITDYGNGLYVDGDEVLIPGQAGGSDVTNNIVNSSTPPTYLQNIVDALNTLGVAVPPCI
jgi:hypothetical protein